MVPVESSFHEPKMLKLTVFLNLKLLHLPLKAGRATDNNLGFRKFGPFLSDFTSKGVARHFFLLTHNYKPKFYGVSRLYINLFSASNERTSSLFLPQNYFKKNSGLFLAQKLLQSSA